MTTATAPLPQVRRQAAAAGSALLAPRLLLAVVMLLAIVLGLAPLVVTSMVVPAQAPAADFSAARAMQDLAVIAAQPHPIGSPANAAVRDYLVASIAKLGLEPQVQKTTLSGISPLARLPEVVQVENILVRVPGAGDHTNAVLLTGHYDSVPTAPGAGDCGACVATTLETLRAVLAGPKLQNDVIFLFTDGEERGIVGARAFMQQHPWVKDVRTSIVFEGLGTRGSSFLYAAGEGSGRLLDAALANLPQAAGYRFVDDVLWKLAHNSGSDLDAFIVDGRSGVAFVNVGLEGSQTYHTAADSVANYDPGILQQHGDHALALVRSLGNADLAQLAGGANPVYFALLPGIVVRYPLAWATPLAIAAALLAAAALILGLWRRRMTWLGLLGGILAVAVSLVVAIAAASLVWWGLRVVNPSLHQPLFGGWYGAVWTTLGLLALSVALVSALQFTWRRKLSLNALSAGALVWWAVLAVLTATALPGFGAMFVWPLLAATLLLGWCWLWPAAAERPWPCSAALAAAAAVTLLLVTPVFYVLAVYAGRMEAMMAVPLAAFPLPFAVLALALLAPQLEFLAPARRLWLPLGALLACVLLLAAGWFGSAGYDAAHPKLNTVVYWINADSGSARWITVDDSRNGRGASAQLDGWTQQFFPNGATATEFNPWLSGWFAGGYPALAAAAQPVAFAQPEIALLADMVEGNERVLKLRIHPAADAYDSHLQVASDAGVTVRTLNGNALSGTQAGGKLVPINIYGRPEQPVELTVTMATGASVRVTVFDRRLGLPQNAGIEIKPRPAWMAASPYNDTSDSTVVEHSATFN